MSGIAVLRPTRGLEFSESSDSVEIAVENYRNRKRRTWTLPIPDSFNTLVSWALGTDLDEFLFVEEDVVIPENAIKLLRDLDVDIAALNYRNKVDPRFISEHRFEDGSLCWVSLGCTLIRRRVFEVLDRPWFVIGKTIAREHPGRKIVLVDAAEDIQYGNQDLYFCYIAREAGFSMETVPGVLCSHLKLEQLGEPGENNGIHKISSI